MCKEDNETTDHALFRCGRAWEVWDIFFPQAYGHEMDSMEIKDRWLSMSRFKGPDLEHICVGAWPIWNDRNSLVHNQPIPLVLLRCEWINSYMEEFWKANPKGGQYVQSLEDISNIISNGEDLILHTDAAFMSSSGKSEIGIVLRNKLGQLQAAQTLVSEVCTSPSGVEAVAVLEGLRLAKFLGVRKVSVILDSLTVTRY